MDSYNKKKVNIAGAITALCAVVALLGWWLSHDYIYVSAVYIPVGLTAIVFSHDLAMRDFVKHKANYKFFRGAYVFAGIVFIVISVVTLANHYVTR